MTAAPMRAMSRSRARTRCASKAAWARSAAARPGPALGTKTFCFDAFSSREPLSSSLENAIGRHRFQRGSRRGITAAGAVDEVDVIAAHHRWREAGHHRRILLVQATAHDAV